MMSLCTTVTKRDTRTDAWSAAIGDAMKLTVEPP